VHGFAIARDHARRISDSRITPLSSQRMRSHRSRDNRDCGDDQNRAVWRIRRDNPRISPERARRRPTGLVDDEDVGVRVHADGEGERATMRWNIAHGLFERERCREAAIDAMRGRSPCASSRDGGADPGVLLTVSRPSKPIQREDRRYASAHVEEALVGCVMPHSICSSVVLPAPCGRRCRAFALGDVEVHIGRTISPYRTSQDRGRSASIDRSDDDRAERLADARAANDEIRRHRR